MIGCNHIKITNVLGKVLYCEDIMVSKNLPILEFSFLSILLIPGFYVCLIRSNSGIKQDIKFFKN